jgi:hypothetical protein
MAGVLCGPAEARYGDVRKHSWHTLLPEVSQFMKCTFHSFTDTVLGKGGPGAPLRFLVQDELGLFDFGRLDAVA